MNDDSERGLADSSPVSRRIASSKRPLVYFGGTFDPPQIAHTRVAQAAVAHFDADLLVVPTAANPLKQLAPTGNSHRLAMTRLAFRPQAFAGRLVEISTIELDRPPPSFTAETLVRLRREMGSQRAIHLLLGSDAALGFARWRDPKLVLEHATPAVALRPPLDEARFLAALESSMGKDAARRWSAWLIDAPSLAIAASDVRARIARGESTDDLLDPAVEAYILEHRLYRAPNDDAARSMPDGVDGDASELDRKE